MIERLLYTGQTSTVSASFLDNGIPITPLDPILYPNYAVFDTEGDVVSFGVGTLNVVSNIYEATITIPTSAKTSTPTHKWAIEWELLDINSKAYKLREFFDVAYPNFKELELKEQKKVTLANVPLILHLPIPSQATSISFGVYDLNNNQVLSIIPLQEGVYNDYYLYKATVPANSLTHATYSALWKFKLEGGEEVYYTTIDVIELSAMKIVSDLRLFIDKSLKEIDLSMGYRDSDLNSFIEMGRGLLNSIVQYTTWPLSFYATTPGFQMPLVYAAAWHGLQSQFMCAGDNVFDYIYDRIGCLHVLAKDH